MADPTAWGPTGSGAPLGKAQAVQRFGQVCQRSSLLSHMHSDVPQISTVSMHVWGHYFSNCSAGTMCEF